MPALRISSTSIFGKWLGRVFPAFILLISAFSAAQADPRIDRETASALVQVSADGDILEQRGMASWYGAHWRGRKTASGVRFNDRLLTAASVTLPLATHARVVNLENGRFVDVLVNDRGPYIAGRIMDLSAAAASALGMRQTGLAQVEIKVQFSPIQRAG